MRTKKGFVLRDICGDKAIIGEGLETIDFSKIVSVNETAAWLWEKGAELGEFTNEQLAEALTKTFDVSYEKALSDVQKLTSKCIEAGLVKR